MEEIKEWHIFLNKLNKLEKGSYILSLNKIKAPKITLKNGKIITVDFYQNI